VFIPNTRRCNGVYLMEQIMNNGVPVSTEEDIDREARKGTPVEQTYKIVRLYQRDPLKRQVIMHNVTLTQAREHCNDPDTSWNTCTHPEGKRRTRECGPWFDAYFKEE
jgi:hypothetical protein